MRLKAKGGKSGLSKTNRKALISAYRLLCTIQQIQSITKEASLDACTGHELLHLIIGSQLKPTDRFLTPSIDLGLLLALGATPNELFEAFNKHGLTILALEKVLEEGIGSNTYHVFEFGDAGSFIPAMTLGVSKAKSIINPPNQDDAVTCCLLPSKFWCYRDNLNEIIDRGLANNCALVFILVIDENGAAHDNNSHFLSNDYFHKSRKPGLNHITLDKSTFLGVNDALDQAINWAMEHQAISIMEIRNANFKISWLGEGRKGYLQLKQMLFNELLKVGATKDSIAEIDQAVKTYVTQSFKRFKHSYSFDEFSKPDQALFTIPKAKVDKRKTKDIAIVFEKILKENEEVVLLVTGEAKPLGFVDKKYWKKRPQKSRIMKYFEPSQYLFGTMIGLAASGLKPIVYIERISTLISFFAEQMKLSTDTKSSSICVSCYSLLIYVSVGADESGLIESYLPLILGIFGINVVYPSNLHYIDVLMRTAFNEKGPVVFLEDQNILIESSIKLEKNEQNSQFEFGKIQTIIRASAQNIKDGNAVLLITFGAGVLMAKNVCKSFENLVTILDLSTLYPLDWEKVKKEVKMHNKLLVLTVTYGESLYSEALVGKIYNYCFEFLDAPITFLKENVVDSKRKRESLQQGEIPVADKIYKGLNELLAY